jgi:hypothetical protein
MAVAKPWIVEVPELLIFQSLGGSPGCVFSQATALTTGGPHGPAAADGSTWSTSEHIVVVKIVANSPTIAGNRLIRNMPNLPTSKRRDFVPVRSARIVFTIAPAAVRNAPNGTRKSLID